MRRPGVAARRAKAARLAAARLVVALVLLPGCRKPPPLEDVWEVTVPVAEALDKPKTDSKVMMQLHAGDILAALPGEPATFERKGKTLSYRRMRRAVEDHAGLVAADVVKPQRAPPASHFCELLGEGEGRVCPTSLVRIRLPSDDYVVYRPSLNELGRLALIEGRNHASKEIRGLSSVSVQTAYGKPWLFVESAVRKSELWTATELAIIAPDRSLRTRLTVLLHEMDSRAGDRVIRTTVVVENGKLRRRGTRFVLGADHAPTQEVAIDEELIIPP